MVGGNDRYRIPTMAFWCATVGLIVFSVFAKARQFGLCANDDFSYVTEHAFVTDGLTRQGMLEAFTYLGDAIWMPLTWMTYMLDHSAGWGVSGMHLVNVVLHAVNAMLLFALLARLARRLGSGSVVLPVCAALLWAVHPLRVESVVWVASRKDELSTLFFLWALFLWIGGCGWRRCLASFVLVAAGALAKPSVMVFPAFALGIDFLVIGERKPVGAYVGLVVLSVLVAAEATFGQSCGAMGASRVIPLWFKLVNAGAALTVYLGNFAWPHELAHQCLIRYPRMPHLSVPGAVLLLLAVSFLVWSLRPRIFRFARTRKVDDLVVGGRIENVVLAVLLIYFSCLLPFVGIVGFGYHAFADRFTLVPSLAFSIGLVAIVNPSACRRSFRCVFALVAATVVALLIARTDRQIRYWKDDATLFGHTIEVDGDFNVIAHRAVGIYHWNESRDVEKVYMHLKKTVDASVANECIFDLMNCCHLLIDAAYDLGRREEADDYYYAMAKWNHRLGGGNSMEFLMAEGLYYLQHGKSGKAQVDLAEMQEKHPDYYATRYLAYRIAKAKGNPEETLAALRRCPTHCRDDGYGRNTWAAKLLAAGER